MVQRTGFEPAKHYALGPHPSPFDHSGTSAWALRTCHSYFTISDAPRSLFRRIQDVYRITDRHRTLFND